VGDLWRRVRGWFRLSGAGPSPPAGASAEERSLEAALGYTFRDRSLLNRALTHSSATVEGAAAESNERLEFLGDAVLDLVVSTVLHEEWDLTEGEMSKVRAAVVSESPLATVAREVGLDVALRLGKGEDASGGRAKAPILADALEAVIGAAFLDGGLIAVRNMVLRYWAPMIRDRAVTPGERDYKTRLQEILAKQGSIPAYDADGFGPDHQRTYRSKVTLDGRVLGTGSGSSKKRAEQDAARAALEALGDEDA